jgi:hypothetical protein
VAVVLQQAPSLVHAQMRTALHIPDLEPDLSESNELAAMLVVAFAFARVTEAKTDTARRFILNRRTARLAMAANDANAVASAD